ncbi:hypothetical protein PLESTB_001119600 [Pleodorina starrii]|uniref:Uncharacterized protein n=1 Tax=Pleodorina starrii TaxID=330485 RepID=A0A9W6BQS5_9CHLO|nr:hypothetical protein PLESTM_001356900 [Pleodorina starrii]GLC56552.1 hypothetical protein PLESTB_001119600 [Pleodorina starrii]GLC68795.1 hypothetical protein PLESTF_000737500 [Pleodorina starrii]
MYPTVPSTCKTTLNRGRTLRSHVFASHSGSGGPQPPAPSPLDRVLKKAANKVKLAHPVSAQDVPQQKPKEQSKRPSAPSTRTAAPQKQRQPLQRQQRAAEVDDDALFNSITESERDSVWDTVKLEVEADSDADWLADDSSFGRVALPAQRRSAPASARDGGPSASSSRSQSQPVASSSGFKGFGSPPPRRPESAPTTTAPTASTAPKTQGPPSSTSVTPASSKSSTAAARQHRQQQPQSSQGKRQAASRPGTGGSLLRVFLFNAEEARTRALLQQLGLAGRVEVVGDLRHANAVLAAKLARSGKHVNLTQGERTAANLGIPFLVVGRNMSADNLRAALLPLLDPKAAEAAAKQAPAVRAPTAAELAAHRMEVAHGFAQMLRQGGVALAAGSGAGVGTGAAGAEV